MNAASVSAMCRAVEVSSNGVSERYTRYPARSASSTDTHERRSSRLLPSLNPFTAMVRGASGSLRFGDTAETVSIATLSFPATSMAVI